MHLLPIQGTTGVTSHVSELIFVGKHNDACGVKNV
jgi:hypothetical protein